MREYNSVHIYKYHKASSPWRCCVLSYLFLLLLWNSFHSSFLSTCGFCCLMLVLSTPCFVHLSVSTIFYCMLLLGDNSPWSLAFLHSAVQYSHVSLRDKRRPGSLVTQYKRLKFPKSDFLSCDANLLHHVAALCHPFGTQRGGMDRRTRADMKLMCLLCCG